MPLRREEWRSMKVSSVRCEGLGEDSHLPALAFTGPENARKPDRVGLQTRRSLPSGGSRRKGTAAAGTLPRPTLEVVTNMGRARQASRPPRDEAGPLLQPDRALADLGLAPEVD